MGYVTPVIVLLTVIVSLFQPTRERLIAANAYAWLLVTHIVLFSVLRNTAMGKEYINILALSYYLSAGFCNLLLIVLIVKKAIISKTVTRLMLISFSFLIVNFVGWLLWLVYLPPVWYDTATTMLMVFALILLLGKEDCGRTEHHRNAHRDSGVCLHDRSGNRTDKDRVKAA